MTHRNAPSRIFVCAGRFGERADLLKTQGEQSKDDKTLRRAAELYLRLAKPILIT
jgi:hypothetical protein